MPRVTHDPLLDDPPLKMVWMSDDEFALNASRQALWLAFLRKNELKPEPLAAVVDRARGVVWLATRGGTGTSRLERLTPDPRVRREPWAGRKSRRTRFLRCPTDRADERLN